MKLLTLLFVLSFHYFASAAYLENSCLAEGEQYKMIHSSTSSVMAKFEIQETATQKTVFVKSFTPAEYMKVLKFLNDKNIGQAEFRLEDSDFNLFTIIQHEDFAYSFMLDGINFIRCFSH